MRTDVDIDALMADTWLVVTQLRYGAPALEGDALYRNCCQQVEQVQKALEQAGYDEESIRHISYAQCALLDETVMGRQSPDGSADAGHKAWQVAPLQARYFGSLKAGEALYDRIAEVLHQPAPVDAVLTCYHRVLALGFRGLYSVRPVDPQQRAETLSALAQRVKPLDTGLSLVITRAGARRGKLLRSVWFWVITALVLTTLIWCGGHAWLTSLLAQQLPGLH